MSASLSRGKGPIAEINVTPLVDVVLVLLIIFMVVTTFDEASPEEGVIPIALPGAATTEPADAEPFTVAVAESGDFVLKGRPASAQAVVDAVRAAQGANPALEVVVGADKNSRHERFVALLDLLRAEGVTRFAIQADATGG